VLQWVPVTNETDRNISIGLIVNHNYQDYTPLVQGIKNNGSWLWNVSTSLIPEGGYSIEIWDQDTGQQDTGDSFSIQAPSSVPSASSITMTSSTSTLPTSVSMSLYGSASVFSSSTSTTTPASGGSSGLDKAGLIGTIVGAIAGVLLLILAVVTFVLGRRRRARAELATGNASPNSQGRGTGQQEHGVQNGEASHPESRQFNAVSSLFGLVNINITGDRYH